MFLKSTVKRWVTTRAGLFKTENDSKLLKNSVGNHDDEWTFCGGQETRIRMIRKKGREQESLKKFMLCGYGGGHGCILSKLKFYQAFFLQLYKLHLW